MLYVGYDMHKNIIANYYLLISNIGLTLSANCELKMSNQILLLAPVYGIKLLFLIYTAQSATRFDAIYDFYVNRELHFVLMNVLYGSEGEISCRSNYREMSADDLWLKGWLNYYKKSQCQVTFVHQNFMSIIFASRSYVGSSDRFLVSFL